MLDKRLELIIPFYKYHGTGNDFIIIDQTAIQYLTENDQEKIAQLCDRRFGVGADGLMFLELEEGQDFKMIYFNADGRTSSMCGNGGRCIVAFARNLGVCADECTFMAIDGLHEANVTDKGLISLKMNDVFNIQDHHDHYILDTGSPHYVRFDQDIASKDVRAEGSSIRHNKTFKEVGVNVNFVEYLNNFLFVRTYERGVEDETYSCGTGVVASALSYALESGQKGNHVEIKTLGGRLSVSFDKTKEGFKNIWLTGPAKLVYQGTISI